MVDCTNGSCVAAKLFSLKTLFLLTSILICLGLKPSVAQDLPGKDSKAGTLTQVESIKLGGHPEYTRVIIGLSEPVRYKIRADFLEKKVRLILVNSVLGSNARSKTLKDRNLRMIEARQITPSKVEIALLLKNPNSRFFHFLKTSPDRIVLDLKGENKPYLKTKIASGVPSKGAAITMTIVAPPR